MLKFLKTGIFLGGILLSNFSYSQDVPLGTLPMFYNSSFAGEADGGRFSTNFSLRRNSFYHTLGVQSSYDQFIPALRSGLGVSVGHFNTFGSFSSYNNNHSTLGLAVAPKFSLKGKLTISPSLDFNYFRQSSEINNAKGYATRVGILINSSKFFFGYSFDVFSNLKIKNVFNSETKQINRNIFDDFNSSIQLGYTFQRSKESKFSFTPQILISVSTFDERFQVAPLKLMLNFRHSNFLWGVSDDGLHVGWQTPRLRLMVFNNVQRLFIKSHIIDPSSISALSFRYNFKK